MYYGSRANITTAKGLTERKKKLYESQVSEGAKADHSHHKVEERRIKEAHFEKSLFDLAKDMMQVFASRNVLCIHIFTKKRKAVR
jgi:hypothetical protein